MATRSLIGVLDADDHSFRARYCHNGGYPDHQVPKLGLALHRFHDGDVERLMTELLSREWSAIDPAAASAECADQPGLGDEVRQPRPSHIEPHGGIGFYYTDVDPDEEPLDGDLGEDPDLAYEWLYLFTGDQLRVFANQPSNQHARRWAPFGDFPVSELATITADETTRRLHARR
ncbi:hypothetical protein [Saccharopolyspora taberi]|uniref:Uncharacterized protein n=1 Tax=Saccharopolyspora taberi TaxID=60895 RepID=A0ABN3VBM2_9PSEU